MLVNVRCKKCGETSKLDIGNYSKEEVIKLLSNDKYGFECFGHHVEFGNRIDYWEIDWDSLQNGFAPTEEEFVADLKKKNTEVYTTKELQNKYNVVSFAMGFCIV